MIRYALFFAWTSPELLQTGGKFFKKFKRKYVESGNRLPASESTYELMYMVAIVAEGLVTTRGAFSRGVELSSSAEEGWSPPVTVPTQMRHSIKLAKFEQKWTNASDSLGKISHLFCLPCFFFLDFINCTDSRGHEESDPCVAKWLLNFLSRLAGSQRPVYKIR